MHDNLTLWEILRRFEGKSLRTLDHAKEFDVLAVGKQDLVVRPRASGEERTISRQEIEHAFRLLTDRREVSLQQLEQVLNTVHSSYIFALLLEHPTVQMGKRPLRLKYLPFGGSSLPDGKFNPAHDPPFPTIRVEEDVEQHTFWEEETETDQQLLDQE